MEARKTLRRVSRKVVGQWEATQVELHGMYSVPRLLQLHSYSSDVSSIRVCLALILTPLPCLLVILLLDLIPLSPPDHGLAHSIPFWRSAIGSFIITYVLFEQYRRYIPSIPATFLQVLVMTTATTIATTAVAFALAFGIGFPVPFQYLLVSPAFMLFLLGSVAIAWGSFLRRNPATLRELVYYQAILMVLLVLTYVYPAYNYVFARLSSSSQTAFALMLPLIKLLAKNAISPFCKGFEDYKPMATTFNVEIFHALFVSTCMQNSTSIRTTGVLTLVDFVHSWLSLRDIDCIASRVQVFQDRVTHQPVEANIQEQSHSQTFRALLHVLYIVRHDNKVKKVEKIRIQAPRRSSSITDLVRSIGARRSAVRPILDVIPVAPVNAVGPSADLQSRTISMVLQSDIDTAHLTKELSGEEIRRLMEELSHDERLEYVKATLQLLYTVEFVLLVEYTEVIIPLVYSIYLLSGFHLPNKPYYPQLRDLTDATLASNIGNVMLYAALELLSFVVLSLVLQRKLRFSPIRQLAFVLDRQWQLVQLKLIVWLLFVVQNSLQHFGSDYTFQFKWLHASPSS